MEEKERDFTRRRWIMFSETDVSTIELENLTKYSALQNCTTYQNAFLFFILQKSEDPMTINKVKNP